MALDEDTMVEVFPRLLRREPPLDHLALGLGGVEGVEVALAVLRSFDLVEVVGRLGVDVVEETCDRWVRLGVPEIEASPASSRGRFLASFLL